MSHPAEVRTPMLTRCAAAALFLCAGFALADSPLTSTDFAAAYADVPAVKSAKEGKAEAAYVVLAGAASNDTKLAIANALGWQRDFATGFFTYLAQVQGLDFFVRQVQT